MNDIKKIVLFSIVSFVGLLALSTSNFPLGGIVFLFAGIFYMYVSYIVRALVKQEYATKDEFVSKYLQGFSAYFFIAGIAALLHPVSHLVVPLFSSDATFINMIDSLTHLPLFAAAVIIFRVTADIFNFKPYAKNTGTAALIVLALAAMVVHVLGEHSPVSGILILAINAASSLLGGIYFLSLGIKSADRTLRKKAILIGIGLIPFIAIGPMTHILSQSTSVILSTYLVFLSTITFTASGILYRPELSLSQEKFSLENQG